MLSLYNVLHTHVNSSLQRINLIMVPVKVLQSVVQVARYLFADFFTRCILGCRYGRLNVLRWLLWEAESREDMPALEKVAANNTTLALHYAAARGCLDCVRLLVDSSPELR